jgi:hypothetical protein
MAGGRERAGLTPAVLLLGLLAAHLLCAGAGGFGTPSCVRPLGEQGPEPASGAERSSIRLQIWRAGRAHWQALRAARHA